MLDSKKLDLVDRIVVTALDCDPAERSAFLDNACGDDAEVRSEVEARLMHESHKTIMSDPVFGETKLLPYQPSGGVLPANIGRFRVVETLGTGGMGRVFLAHDEKLNRPVAIKTLVASHSVEDEWILRFQQEALAASALNHPNILTIYEVGEADGKHFIAAEFVEGSTLASLIANDSLTIDDSLNIASQIASALSIAHAKGIIHRDIKPANVMVRSDGLVKILDFGIAKYQEHADEADKKALVDTVPGSVVGTVCYMSPEQTRGLSVDTRTDIWSLGVVLYEMLAGTRPFNGDTAADVMSAVIDRPPASLAGNGRKIPSNLEQVLLKALQKVRDSRYQTAEEFLAALNTVRRGLASGFEPATRIISGSSPDRSREDARSAGMTNLAAKVSRSNKNFSGPTDPLPEVETRLKDRETTDVSDHGPHSRTRLLTLTIVGILLLATTALAYWYYNKRHAAIESIAVLPFKNDSGNNEVDYLSDGIPDSLINSLSQLPNLSVKARSSVYRYKGKEIDPQRVAAELAVQAVLTGRLVQHGSDLTVFLSLVDPAGNQIWGTQYDRKLTDLVSLQREIAKDVSQNVRVKLTGADEQKLAKDYTANGEAYQLYLKGRYHVFKLTPPEIQLGIEDFQHAIQLDPAYALAYVGLSEANRSLALGSEMPPNEYLSKAKEAAQKALAIDDKLAEAHTAYGTTVFWYDRDWAEAENQFKRALELNPNYMDTHLFYAHLCSNTGRHDQALAEIKKARELDPVAPFASALEGQFLTNAGKVDEGIASLRESMSLSPGFWFPHLFIASAYIEKGMYAEAITEARRAQQLSGVQTLSAAYEGYVLAKEGKIPEARATLDALLKLSNSRYVPAYHVALIYNGLGETDEVIAWLRRSLDEHDPKITFLKVDPKWNNLHSDPRFQQLLTRAGF